MRNVVIVLLFVFSCAANSQMGPNKRKRFEAAVMSDYYAYKWCREKQLGSRAFADYISIEGEKNRVYCDGLSRNIANNPTLYVDDYEWWSENQ